MAFATFEATDIGAVDQVAGRAVFLGRFEAVLVDGDHDLVQTIVHFLASPAQACAVLGHFEAGGGYAASVGGLCRSGLWRHEAQIRVCDEFGGYEPSDYDQNFPV